MKLGLGRRRHGAPRLRDDRLRLAWQVISLLLEYPDSGHRQRLAQVQQAIEPLPAPVRRPIEAFIAETRSIPLPQLQSCYVETFDLNRRCALYLSYYSHGDTRRRGVALLRFRQLYQSHGVDLCDQELPDHLCVVLEFGATVDLDGGWRLLNEHRVGIEILHDALVERQSPWAALLEGLIATLPALSGDHDEAIARLIAQGPPSEEVGLDGYALDPSLTVAPRPAGATPLGATIPVGAPR